MDSIFYCRGSCYRDRGRDRDRGSDRTRGMNLGTDHGRDRDRGSHRGRGRDRNRDRGRDRTRGMNRGTDHGTDRGRDRDRGKSWDWDRGSSGRGRWDRLRLLGDLRSQEIRVAKDVLVAGPQPAHAEARHRLVLCGTLGKCFSKQLCHLEECDTIAGI